MNRLFYNSEIQFYDTIDRKRIQDLAEANSKRVINEDALIFNNKQSYMYPQDILFNGESKWNGMMGNLKYTRDTSIKGEYYLLNKYGEDFIAGNNGLLQNSVNKAKSKVSSYDVENSAVLRQEPKLYKKGTFIIKK